MHLGIDDIARELRFAKTYGEAWGWLTGLTVRELRQVGASCGWMLRIDPRKYVLISELISRTWNER